MTQYGTADEIETREAFVQNASYTEGMADMVANTNPEMSKRLRAISYQLKLASEEMCGQGYFGCDGGPDCDSDHK